jgi:hypothetical protein
MMEFDNFIGRQKMFLSEKECETVIDAMYDKKLHYEFVTGHDEWRSDTCEFKHLDHSEKPETGKLLFFPAGYTHYHRASPELKGQKYIITGWLTR